MGLLDLPEDIIVLVFPYLDATDFLSFTSCTRVLLPYRSYRTYWSYLTRATFRLPPQPMLQATSDNDFWPRLYRTLRTQSTVFTWGNDGYGNLGHLSRERATRRSLRQQPRSTGWPGQMENLEDLGVVSDVQCGGWSTVLLSASGQLWAVGKLNGMRAQDAKHALEPLTFPSPYPPSDKSRYEPSTAISQYSLGRELLLGLSDDGKIWEWIDFSQPGQMIKFFHLETGDGSVSSHKVLKIVTGWSACSAYVSGVGIVYWSARPSYDSTEPTDTLIVEHVVVPGTSFRSKRQGFSDELASSIGEVTNYVFLEHYIVFATNQSRVYVWKSTSDPIPGLRPKELTSFHKQGSVIQDLQGSFRRFGVFTDTGNVLTGDQDLLDRVWDSDTECAEAGPTSLPALQQAGVISLAFGDWHYHALHSNGTITSHGHEPGGCGALGLGSRSLSQLRGVYFPRRPGGDGNLQVPSWSNGRRTVWFEEEKERWLSDTCQRGATSEAKPRADLVASNAEAAGLMGEWFEREGQNWADGPSREPISSAVEQTNHSTVGAYRALKIAAAGWSSAALVLVDGDRAEEIRKQYLLTPAEESASIETNQGGGVLGSIASLGRSLLGMGELSTSESTPDGSATTTQPTGHRQAALASRSNHLAAPSEVDTEIYVWDEHPYPRLQYPDGRTMPGEVAVTPWRGAGEMPSV